MATGKRMAIARRFKSWRICVTELNKDEKVVVTRSSFNVANTIVAIALLLLVLGVLKYFGVSPI
jgi:hypothetical protein